MYNTNNISANYELLLDWLELKQSGIELEHFFLKKGFKNIAIYGMNRVADCFIRELEESKIKIKYISDQNELIADLYPNFVYYKPDQIIEIDAIVVFPIIQYEEIKKELNKYVNCPIYSIETVIKSI